MATPDSTSPVLDPATPHVVATLFSIGAAPHTASDETAPDNTGYITADALTEFKQMLLPSIIPALSSHTLSITTRPLQRSPRPEVVEITFPAPSTTLQDLRRYEAVAAFESKHAVELVFQHDSIHRRHKRLAVFDMDSTLIQQEVIDEIADMMHIKPQIAAITAAAMNGELDFEASLRRRCALLKGVRSDVFELVKERISYTEGVPDLIRCLQKLGFKTAVLSGGFTPLTGWLAGPERLNLDYAYANHLVVSDDGASLTGELTGAIVHAEQKRAHVLEIAEREGIALEQVVCIGDGANDLPMMGVAGLGVAFHAKPKVQREAPARLNRRSMLDLLYLMGITREEREELLR